MDFNAEKILEEDYRSQRQVLMKEGAGILRRIDILKAGGQLSSKGSEIDDEIEAAIMQIRGEREDRDGGFCPSCGSEVKADDLFCIRCGNTLSAVEEQA